jgi:hypothetical protein
MMSPNNNKSQTVRRAEHQLNQGLPKSGHRTNTWQTKQGQTFSEAQSIAEQLKRVTRRAHKRRAKEEEKRVEGLDEEIHQRWK